MSHSQLHNLVSNGGKVLVVGGYNKSFQEFRNHPQIEFWTGDTRKDIQRKVKAACYPDNLKAVIISRFVSHSDSVAVLHEARKKKATIFAPLSDGQVKRTLNEMFTGPIGPDLVLEEIKEKQLQKEEQKMNPEIRKPNRGEVITLVKKHLGPASVKEEVERLSKIFTEQGIKTTKNSIANAIYRARSSSTPSIPKPKKEKKEKKSESSNHLLVMMDEAITAMQLVREEVAKLDTMSTDYMKLKEKLRTLLD